MFYTKLIKTPVGNLLATANTEDLLGLKYPSGNSEQIKDSPNHIIKKLEQELELYFQKKLQSFSIPLQLEGTDFQVKVWKALLEIPYGKTISYQIQARNINMPKAMRAVANANGRNPFSIIIPCHRVIRNNGELGGYFGGVESKKYLLDLEGEGKMF